MCALLIVSCTCIQSHGGVGEENVMLDMATDLFVYPFINFPPEGHSFLGKESRCKTLFDRALHHFGLFYHLHTPEKHPVIFRDPQDYRAAMTIIATCAFDCPGIRIITFELMSNHVHFVVCGSEDEVMAFFELFKKRLKRYFGSLRKAVDLSGFIGKTVGIPTLEALRNQIGYTNRNNYVINPAYTPFSYPYGAGNCYFPAYQIRPDYYYKEMTFREKRKMLHTHRLDYPGEMVIVNQHISPVSFCMIHFGESVFRDARHYFFKISREIESYKEIAEALYESVYYTDDELNAVIYKICNDRFDGQQATLLPHSDKIMLAKKLHFEYNADNGKIARLLKLQIDFVDSLFPLKKKQ